MNFNRILVLSFLVLVISTYQTDSGIILSLLLKVLLLKGALFMSMPLTIGAFMMGQGMGFFAGNMMGGYMMLRAANRYHNQEKGKWLGHTDVSPFHHQPSSGWGQHHSSHKYQHAYDKGKDIGSALSALKSHKLKLKSVIHTVKSAFAKPKYPGWSSSPYASYGPPSSYHYKRPTYQKSPGWGWGSSSSLGSYGSPSTVHDHYYGSHSKPQPVAAKYKLYPYDTYKQLTAEKVISQGYGGTKASVGVPYKSEEGEILKGQMLYQNFYPPGSVPADSYQAHASNSQDPSNTFYTSAYGGPGHEYTGILTHNQPDAYVLDEAQDKSSEESGFYTDKEKLSPLSSSSERSSTVSPNPLLEKYLEKRLEEEAEKQKDVEQKQEAQQLIQMLRKAYLKQLVTSLKEEEQLGSGSTESAEFTRGSRSIEDSNKNNIIGDLLFKKMPGSTEKIMEARSFENVDELILQKTPLPIASLEMPIQVSSTEKLKSSTENVVTSTERLTSTGKPIISTENYVSSTETYVSSTESPISSTESPQSPNEEPPVHESSTTKTPNEIADLGMPAMWVKADNTFSNEASPFMIRVKRSAATEAQGGEEVSEETQSQDEGQEGQQPESVMPEETQKQIVAFVDDIKKFFTLLTVLDQDQCLQKLVCDVHTNQKDISTITQYEQNILTTFKLMKALMPPGEEDSSTKYRRAALIGETGQSLELCQQTFSPCGFSSSQIITLGTQAEATPTDWAGTEAQQATASALRRRSDYVTVMPRVRRTLRSYYV